MNHAEEPRIASEPPATGLRSPAPIEESTPARLRVEEMSGVYSRLAPLYQLWQRFVQGRSLRAALDLAAVRNGAQILEIALGPGTVFESLAKRNPGGVTVGVDLTPGMLERTRRRLQHASLTKPGLCRCNALRLPFAAESFDLVFSSYFLDLLSTADIETAIGEMRRVLRPSGKLVICYLSLGNPWFDRAWNVLCWFAPVLLGGSRPIGLAAYLPFVGFTITERRRIVERGIPAEVILARRA